jgi:hypothetical protein
MLLLVLPAVASAQTTTDGGTFTTTELTLAVAGGEPVVLDPDQCGETIVVNWAVRTIGLFCSDLTIWATTGECADAFSAAAGDKLLQTTSANALLQQNTGSVSIPVGDLPAFAGFACGALDQQVTTRICGAFGSAALSCDSGRTVIRATTAPTILYDTLPPPAPVLESVDPGDGLLIARLGGPSTDADQVHVEVRRAGSGEEFVRSISVNPTTERARLRGLTNGVAYEVQAVAQDAAGNLSAPSATLVATPIHTEGFFEDYRKSGGQDQGGCDTTAGPALSALAALLLWATRLRPRGKAER